MDRRTFLRGLIAAPIVITTPGLLMPVRALRPPLSPYLLEFSALTTERWTDGPAFRWTDGTECLPLNDFRCDDATRRQMNALMLTTDFKLSLGSDFGTLERWDG